ncbi:MAG TPA: carboxypeptidase-like regulatory domain-containing protein [Candidatus Dormibacteraeota bacterium]|nr:carboxypeptidase-like regulatory domain-containing protein [Candidatus Dormibacteraeota bacterium]
MNSRKRLKTLDLLAILPALAGVFWLTALIASDLPGQVVVGVNVHGLNLTSFAGDPGQRPAPLSLSILDDAQQDRLEPTATPAPTSTRVLPAPTAPRRPNPAPTPTPTPTSPFPVPTPTLPTGNPTPTAGSATISGQVTDSQTHGPIAAATVSFNPGGMAVLTDANGNFTANVAPGSYTVTASAVNYNSSSQTVTVSNGQRVSLAFRLVSITAIGNLSGRVIDASTRAPIAGATVTLSNGLIRVTDLNGNFSYTVVLAGTYTMTVSALGYVTQTQSLSIRSGRTTTVQVALGH